ncbi:MAG: T9SS type A sorting domain-containing protein [Saprospiraceae bacterium]|nr:T9SS type A sorting domain-containing protein [Saprospiraceae bacterium]
MPHLKTVIFVLALLMAFPWMIFAQVQIGQDIDGDVFADAAGFSVCMPDAQSIAVGMPEQTPGSNKTGFVRVFTLQGETWVQKGMDIEGEAEQDWFGYSVSMPDANAIAIGAIQNDGNGTNAGHVRIYTWNGVSWHQKGSDINGEVAVDESGWSVSMPDANTVAIGAPQNDGNGTDAGHVRIYIWNGFSWIQRGVDLEGESSNRKFGHAVSMPDNRTIAIGAYLNAGNGSGHVQVYTWDGLAWIQKGSDITGEAKSDYFGWSVNMPDTNTVAIGAHRNDGNGQDAGHVRIYAWNGNSWAQKGQDIDGEAALDWSGYSVSMSDANNVAIGAPKNNLDRGLVRVYTWNGANWIQLGLDIVGEANGDRSGQSVSMPNENNVAIGAPYNNHENVQWAGHTRVYQLSGVQGLVYNDLDKNCILDDPGILQGIKGIIQPGDILVETNANGIWYLDSLPIGSYTITYDTTGLWKATCPNPVLFSISDPEMITQVPYFGMVNSTACPDPNISIHMPFIRLGFDNQFIFLKACNPITATGALLNSYIEIMLDDLLTLDGATMNYSDLGDNTFRFNIGTLKPGDCQNIFLFSTVSDTAILGETICMEAQLFPVLPCMIDTTHSPPPPDFIPCNLPYDSSSLTIIAACVSDSLVFTITNTGTSDMDCFSPIRLYIDGKYLWLDSVQLKGGESVSFPFPSDGRTWRMEVDQHPLYPGSSHPSATIELCGDSTNWTPDLIDILPHDDEVLTKDVFCGIVRASYDPNDKTVVPRGVEPDHIISPNTQLDYVIRFQNTGTDFAHTVVIRDTLDKNLSIFSVVEGVSSHPNTFRLYGPRVLEWTFENIQLPDSTSNEPGSHGFVTFTTKQVRDLPDGTILRNRAGIYFDFNEPVITNTTHLLVNRQIKLPSWTEIATIAEESCDAYTYNSFTYTTSGTYYQIHKGPLTDTLVTLNLVIHSVSDISTTINGNTLSANNSIATYQWLDCDQDFAVIPGETSQSFTAVVDGNYAVQLSENNCVDTSACVAVTTVGILDNTFPDHLTIFPNPTSGELFLQFDTPQEELRITLLTLDSQPLDTRLVNNVRVFTYTLNAPAGVYLLRMTNHQYVATVKVVKE